MIGGTHPGVRDGDQLSIGAGHGIGIGAGHGVHLERDMVMLVCMTVSRMDCPLNVTWNGKENPVKGGFCPHLKCSVPKEKGLILDQILTNLGYS